MVAKLPSELKEIMGEYLLFPVNKDDLDLLSKFDDKGRLIPRIFGTSDKKKINRILEIIEMEEDENDPEQSHKQEAALELGYYPLIRALYYRYGPYDWQNLFKLAMINEDYQTAADVHNDGRVDAGLEDGPFEQAIEEKNYSLAKSLIERYHPHSSSHQMKADALKEMANHKWFDLFQMLMLKNSDDWDYFPFIRLVVRYPGLDDFFREIVCQHSSEINDLKDSSSITVSVLRVSHDKDIHRQIMRECGIDEDIIQMKRLYKG